MRVLLESIVVNGMKLYAPISQNGGNYSALIGRKFYVCEKSKKGYTIKGDNLRAAMVGDDPFFPGKEDDDKDKRVIYDAVPELVSP
ncbi:MAG: hypothetical protein ABSG05_00680 [Candidatus Pacearchaeota archaeon]|jgi:hypothetical protein